MTRIASYQRIIDQLNIPADDVMDCGYGFVAVKPSWIPAIRAAFADQNSFIRWLNRGYYASKVWHSPSDAHYLINTVSSSFYDRMVKNNPASWGNNGGGAGIVVSGVGASPGTLTLDWITITSGARSIVGIGVVKGTEKTFMNKPCGPMVTCTVNYNYFNHGMSTGGVPASNGDSGKWVGGIPESMLTITPLPAGRMQWPLISGPAVVTWAELYDDIGFMFAECVHIADLITGMLPDVPDGNNRVKAIAQRDALAARGADLMGWVETKSLTAWSLYPPTTSYAGEIASQTGVKDGVDFTAVNRQVAGQLNRRTYVSVPVEDSYKASAAFLADYPNPYVVSIVGDGNTKVAGVSVPVADVKATIPLLVENGVVCAVAPLEAMAEAPAIQLRDDLVALCGGAGAGTNLYVPGSCQENGVVGLALVSAAMQPLKPNQENMVRALLTPGILDAMVGAVQ